MASSGSRLLARATQSRASPSSSLLAAQPRRIAIQPSKLRRAFQSGRLCASGVNDDKSQRDLPYHGGGPPDPTDTAHTSTSSSTSSSSSSSPFSLLDHFEEPSGEQPSGEKSGAFASAAEPQASTSASTSTHSEAIGATHTAASAYDDLFAGPDPFPKVHPSNTVPRNGLSDWGHIRSAPPRRSDKPRHGGRLSKHEAAAWNSLLDDMAGAWNINRKTDKNPMSPPSPLEDFARRNRLRNAILPDASVRNHRRKRTLGTGLGLLPSLGPRGEGPMAATREEIEVAVDQAIQAMLLCETESDLWEWASKEIWGFDEARYRRRLQQQRRAEQIAAKRAAMKAASEGLTGIAEAGAEAGPEAEAGAGPEAQAQAQAQAQAEAASAPSSAQQATETSIGAVSAISQAPYGPATPFYAAVVHRLFLQFRDRFQSPTSAIVVVRIVRALGPNSFVLGGTPELYAVAIRTYWEWLKDLRGAHEVFREARNAGLPCHEPGNPIYETVQAIRDDVRRAILSRKVSGSMYHQGGGEEDAEDDFDPTSPLFATQPAENEQSLSNVSWPTDMDAPGESILRPSAANDRLGTDAAQSPTSIDLTKLSLASLEALRLVDKMGEQISQPARAARRPLQQRFRRQHSQLDRSGGGGSQSGAGYPRQRHQDGDRYRGAALADEAGEEFPMTVPASFLSTGTGAAGDDLFAASEMTADGESRRPWYRESK
ncbi:unnamed protein product [Parajaminaea phylloscopi]